MWADDPVPACAEVLDYLAVVRLNVGDALLPVEWPRTRMLELSLGPQSPPNFCDVPFTFNK